ncbi:MAG: hypothetical protein QOG89_2846, partial [Thermomicrobiales bacterium]|nr:hypothetical protein [Thermomicrobiales bacterium]
TIDDERIEDVDRPFSLQGEAAMLRVGKKRYMRVVVR